MTPEQFRALYPQLLSWIEQTLAKYKNDAHPVTSLGFRRLPQYFSKELLASTKVVSVAHVPAPPLSEFGTTGFEEFENMDGAGTTYLDTYFVQTKEAGREWLHFHELIHVVQWRLLGPERFVATYAAGLERFGYRNNPLETIAYDTQAKFEGDQTTFDAEHSVRTQLHLLNLI